MLEEKEVGGADKALGIIWEPTQLKIQMDLVVLGEDQFQMFLVEMAKDQVLALEETMEM